MKGYRGLIPVILVLAFAVAFYVKWDGAKESDILYEQYLYAAEDKRRQEVVGDAMAYYMAALELKPSKELYLKIGEYYKELGDLEDTLEWGETMISAYPKDKFGYEFLMEIYINNGDNMACFRMFDRVVAKGVKSDYITNHVKEIENSYYFSGGYTNVGEFSEYYCPVQLGSKWGYANIYGGQAVATVFEKVGAFNGGMAPIVDENNLAYFIDASGARKYILLDVEGIESFGTAYNGVYPAYNGKNYAFYNTAHQYLFGEYDFATSIVGGVAAVQNEGQWSLVNMRGEAITKETYTEVVYNTNEVVVGNERIFVKKDDKYSMLDINGKVISDRTFEAVDMFNDATYAAVKENGKWLYIDKNGKTVLETEYEEAKSFSNGYAAVKKDGKWGYIDMSNQFIVEPQFEDAKEFNEYKCAFVKRNGIWTMLILIKFNH